MVNEYYAAYEIIGWAERPRTKISRSLGVKLSRNNRRIGSVPESDDDNGEPPNLEDIVRLEPMTYSTFLVIFPAYSGIWTSSTGVQLVH